MTYLNTRVGVYSSVKSKKTGNQVYVLSKKVNTTLGELLTSGNSQHLIRAYRATKQKHVKDQIVSYTPAGYWPDKRHKTVRPATETGLVQIDIDGKSNPHITDWLAYRQYLFTRYPFIAVCALSCGGAGLYLLCNSTGYDHYEGHFFAIAELLHNSEELNIDTSVSSPNEIRYLSLPEDALIRSDAAMFTEIREKPKNEFDAIFIQGDGKLVEIPEELRGHMQRKHVVDFITRNLHNGVTIDQVQGYLSLHARDYMSPNSHMYGDAQAYCTLAEDLYRRYNEQFNQAAEVGQKAKLTSGSTGIKLLVHPGSKDRENRLKEYERLQFALSWVYGRVHYDVLADSYKLDDGTETGPGREYEEYNALADDLTYIDKHFFVTAFETGKIPRVNSLKLWSESLPDWDKKDWIKKFAGYLPAKDPVQAELFLKGWLIRSYIQGCNPGDRNVMEIVNRWFLILHQHKEDSGKSSYLQWLSPNMDWVKLSGIEESKDGYSAMAKYLFVLDDELKGLGSFKYYERLKAMISTAKVDVRPPYAKADINLPRVTSFYGSTNSDNIFPASEGNTRFLVIPLRDEAFNWREYTRTIDKQQLWAQVKHLAGTDWLEKNSGAIADIRKEINSGLTRESLEVYAVSHYLQADTSGNVLPAGRILELLRDDYDYKNLNINNLGNALRSQFGERVNGYMNGKRMKGYPVMFSVTQSVTQGSDSRAAVAVALGDQEQKAKLGVSRMISRRPNATK